MKLTDYPRPANGSKRGVHWNASNYPLFNNYSGSSTSAGT
jgi:hypothetical protein